MVPNPYPLPFHIPPSISHFSVLDLKDAFFTLTLHPQSQDLFTLTGTDPDTFQSTQVTWTVLPQGFRDSPQFFSQALANGLATTNLQPRTLIQYVHELLLCSPSYATAI